MSIQHPGTKNLHFVSRTGFLEGTPLHTTKALLQQLALFESEINLATFMASLSVSTGFTR